MGSVNPAAQTLKVSHQLACGRFAVLCHTSTGKDSVFGMRSVKRYVFGKRLGQNLSSNAKNGRQASRYFQQLMTAIIMTAVIGALRNSFTITTAPIASRCNMD